MEARLRSHLHHFRATSSTAFQSFRILAERRLGLPHSNSNNAGRMTIILGQARKEGGPSPPALVQILHQKKDERQ